MSCKRDIKYSLISAVRKGDIRSVRKLIHTFGLSYSSAWSKGYVLLLEAIKSQHTEIAKLLLTYGSKVNNKNNNLFNTPLYWAIMNGDIEIVKMLLDRGANIDTKNGWMSILLLDAIQIEQIEMTELILIYQTLLQYGFIINPEDANNHKFLHIVVEKGYLKIVEDLLKYGADVNMSHSLMFKKGYTLLHSAAENNQEEVAKLLISYGANINAKDERENTPIFYAIENVDLKIFKLLLTNGAAIKDNPKLLNTAAEKKCKKIVKILLQHGADVNDSDEYGRTALHFIASGSLFDKEPDIHVMGEIAEMLLSKGANVNAKDKSGNTSIFYAIEKGNLKITKLLLINGADIKDNPKLLNAAVKTKCKKIVEILLQHGADINGSDKYGRTALHFTGLWFFDKEYIHVMGEIAEMLLSKGANVNAKDLGGHTPIFYTIHQNVALITKLLLINGADIRDPELLNTAVQNKYREIFDILLKKGANVNAKDKSGNTPIFYAIQNLDSEFTKLLLTNGADLKDNPKLLNTAAEKKCKKIVEILLQHGADVKGSDEYGRTALHFAASGSLFDKEPDIHVSVEIAEMLLSKGANVNAKDIVGHTPIFYTIQNVHLKITKLLLTNGVDVKDNPEFLNTAVQKKCKKIAEMLVSKGANVNAKDESGNTPIFYTIENVDFKITKFLLTNGADIKGNPKILNTAVEKQCKKIVEILLQHGADVNGSDKYGRTPLHVAALKKVGETAIHITVEIAEMLLSKGANVNAQTRDGDTALHYAVNQDFTKLVEILLKYGARYDSIILNTAADKYKLKILETFLKFTAEVDWRDSCGKTMLHAASERGNIQTVNVLLDYCADINITTNNNYTPLECAYGEVSRILKKHTVKIKAAGLYVNERNLLFINNDEMRNFQNECEAEIRIMEVEKIDNSNASFYDIVTKSISQLAIYARNENIVQTLKSGDIKMKFPVYSSMIYSRFKRGIEKKYLLEQGYKLFHSLAAIPPWCTEKILSYLSVKDLRILIHAGKALNNTYIRGTEKHFSYER